MSVAPFPVTAVLTAIALSYRNTSLIADAVLPRVPVEGQKFTYLRHTKEEAFTVPDTRVGRKGKPNQVDFSAAETPGVTEDFGLDSLIPQADIDNAPKNYDPVGRSVEGTTDLILLDREVRVANMVFNAANYAAGNKEILAGVDQISDYVNSDPAKIIQEAMDSCLVRPNKMAIGRLVFSQLSRHPKILKGIHGNSGDSGLANRKQIAELLELDEILVGSSFLNTARKGQNPNFQRVWGKHLALFSSSTNADTKNGMTFGLTAEWGSRISGAQPDGDIGLRGGQRVRVGESVKELITANDLGYFIEDAIA